ncbi:MAG: ribulose-phosphate 3-epimerase [Flavobacteriales bacterium]|mgnify:CR=1 FL=1|nr:ribulose-phosphate 3-epimerase [Flavobacteriales bacterium]
MSHIVAPSLLSADFANLQAAVELVDKSSAPWLHLDVMDGVFVPNISFGLPVIKAIRKHTQKTFDVHLMIVEPQKFIQEFSEAGADVLTVHFEACTHLHRTVQSIRAAGMKVGVALNPHTPISVLDDILGDIDLVCLMSVNPGFGGQKFIPNTYRKITALRELMSARGANFRIEIDGGVGLTNAAELVKAGADVLVAGNSVFNAKDPLKAIDELGKA